MASIHSYTTKTGETRYRVSYRTPDHSPRTKRGFLRKRDAELFRSSVEVTMARGDYIDPALNKATIRELGDVWLASQTHLKPSSLAPVESAYRLHVLPAWAEVRLNDIRHSHVQSWVSELSDTKGATLVIRSYGILAAIIDVAVKDRRVLENVARGVKLPKKTKKRRAYLTHTQVDALAEHSGTHSTLVYLLAYTGLRWGEAIALRVKDLDLLKRRLTVTENAPLVAGVIRVGTPKANEARSLVYPEFLAVMLAKECEGKGRESLVFGDGHNYLATPKHGHGWVERAVRQCQALDDTFPRVTPHDLRHTAASLAVSAGANVKALQRMLGHASAAMTLDTYADLFDSDLELVADNLETARERALEKALEHPSKTQSVVNMLSRAKLS
jgi:integrase